jgi:protein phosphatase
MIKHNYRKILTSFIQAFTPLIDGNTRAIIPIVESETVVQLCKEAQKKFKEAPPHLELEPPIVVFGDIHGHVLDLVRLINEFIINPEFKDFKFLFLGDLVDRGEFSVETIIMIFLLIVMKPGRVFSIRGNHEFDAVAKTGGFHKQILETYPSGTGETVYQFILSVFDWMPFSAKIGSNVMCLHGGISPLLFSVNQLKSLERPYQDFSNKLIDDILWSDPRNIIGFQSSNRGLGCYFGESTLRSFLANNNLDLLVRGHECVCESKYTHGRKCLTVFSASNYCGKNENKSSVLIIRSQDEREAKNFEPMKYLRREEVTFKREGKRIRSLSSVTPIPRLIVPLNRKQNKKDMKKISSILFRDHDTKIYPC